MSNKRLSEEKLSPSKQVSRNTVNSLEPKATTARETTATSSREPAPAMPMTKATTTKRTKHLREVHPASHPTHTTRVRLPIFVGARIVPRPSLWVRENSMRLNDQFELLFVSALVWMVNKGFTTVSFLDLAVRAIFFEPIQDTSVNNLF